MLMRAGYSHTMKFLGRALVRICVRPQWPPFDPPNSRMSRASLSDFQLYGYGLVGKLLECFTPQSQPHGRLASDQKRRNDLQPLRIVDRPFWDAPQTLVGVQDSACLGKGKLHVPNKYTILP